MKKTLAILMAGVMTASLAACGGGSGDGGSSDSAAKVLRFGELSANVGYDAQTNTDSKATAVEDCIVEPLYRWNDDNVEVPVLAKDFPEISEDGLEYTFTLQEGVKFSDGTELKSSDVKFTFERMFNPDTKATSTYMYDMIKGADEMLKGEADTLEGFEIVDDTTFKITLEQPFSCFVKNLGISYASIYPEKACTEAGADWGVDTLIGTGPYMMESQDTTGVVMKKNPNYWGDEPHFDEIDVVYYADENTKMLAFENGDIDVCQVANEMYAQYKDSEMASDFHEYYPLGTGFLNINNSKEFAGKPNPLADVRVREAISLAADRAQIVEYMNGLGTVATGTINPQQLGYKEREAYEHNIDKAKELLKEAGYENGFEFTATLRVQDVGKMTVLQDSLREIGIEMNINQVDAAVWTSERNAGNVQACLMEWFPLYADADNNIYSWFHSTNATGKSCFYNNEKFDKLMDDARLSTDDSERQTLYEQADDILSRQDYGCVPLYYPTFIYAAKPYVTNFKVGNLIFQLGYDIDFDMDKYAEAK